MIEHNKQKGMVLVTIILFLGLLTALLLTQSQALFIFYKAINQAIISDQHFYQLETEAMKLSRNVQRLPHACMTTNNDPNDVINLLQHKQGCSFKKDQQQYFYLINDLGSFPCLQVKMREGTAGTYHWLVNVATETQKFQMLQLRVAMLQEASLCEKKESNLIKTGLLSWRYLAYKN